MPVGKEIVRLRNMKIDEIINKLAKDDLSETNLRVIQAALELKKYEEMKALTSKQIESNNSLARTNIAVAILLGIFTIVGTVLAVQDYLEAKKESLDKESLRSSGPQERPTGTPGAVNALSDEARERIIKSFQEPAPQTEPKTKE